MFTFKEKCWLQNRSYFDFLILSEIYQFSIFRNTPIYINPPGTLWLTVILAKTKSDNFPFKLTLLMNSVSLESDFEQK